VPLLTAIRARDETAVELLLDAGADPSIPIDVPPLHYAISCGLSRRSIERLISAWWARVRASDGQAIIVEYAKKDRPWWNGFEMPSPLLEACAKGHLEALEVLINDMRDPRVILNKVCVAAKLGPG
jgi:hypothetical protein